MITSSPILDAMTSGLLISPASTAIAMPGYLQIGRAVPTTPWELVSHATPVTQVVLVILLILSLLSWAIMVMKWREFRRTEQAAQAMWHELEHTTRLHDLRQLQRRAHPSPFVTILTRALAFLGELKRGPAGAAAGAYSSAPAGAPAPVAAGAPYGGSPAHGEPIAVAPEGGPLTGSQIEALRLVLDSETVSERDKLGRYIPTLAVIGSASPLLGLLGTVIGVIDAFLGIATQGSGNLSAVAPGVAEALIATAAALSVAIPAVFGYNIFASRLNRVDGELEAFGTEIIAVLVREGQI